MPIPKSWLANVLRALFSTEILFNYDSTSLSSLVEFTKGVQVTAPMRLAFPGWTFILGDVL